MPENHPDHPGHFSTTRWSLVRRAGDEEASSHRASLEELLRRYLPALRAHLVAIKRLDPHEADDLVQGFAQSKVLEGGLIARADREKGKFRTLLLTALDHYIADHYRRIGARKRCFERGVSAAVGPPGTAGEPADAFDVEWARATIDEALRRMQSECAAKGRPEVWGVFEHRVLAETLGGPAPLPYDEMVARFGFRSPAQASNVLMTAKRMFARALRSVLADYDRGDSDAIEAELRELLEILGRSGGGAR
jgi:DNA-directed RNA polymerase specialized sigma24 family protein